MTTIDLPEDRGCLRWVLAVPLALIYLPAAYLCYVSLALRPDSPYDQLHDDVRFTADVSVFLCFAGLLLTAVPVFHRNLGRWWYAAPFLLAAVAFTRGQTV
ncbi:hypothetical protein [Streptomyces sp. NBC_00091]|uniref:hypothetical protein n=1 Tax=Streptomyces sp. NBC_00091 TaxID=2975648 RepID=UPI002252D99A|nr:hypothetical protein [Streptomyces sp. NBC_00091]MCX5377786.1 hypothetical protein [Streptomyces sp. NBC_00091]